MGDAPGGRANVTFQRGRIGSQGSGRHWVAAGRLRGEHRWRLGGTWASSRGDPLCELGRGCSNPLGPGLRCFRGGRARASGHRPHEVQLDEVVGPTGRQVRVLDREPVSDPGPAGLAGVFARGLE